MFKIYYKITPKLFILMPKMSLFLYVFIELKKIKKLKKFIEIRHLVHEQYSIFLKGVKVCSHIVYHHTLTNHNSSHGEWWHNIVTIYMFLKFLFNNMKKKKKVYLPCSLVFLFSKRKKKFFYLSLSLNSIGNWYKIFFYTIQ